MEILAAKQKYLSTQFNQSLFGLRVLEANGLVVNEELWLAANRTLGSYGFSSGIVRPQHTNNSRPTDRTHVPQQTNSYPSPSRAFVNTDFCIVQITLVEVDVRSLSAASDRTDGRSRRLGR